MAHSLPKPPILNIEARMPDGTLLRGKGAHSPDLEGKDGYNFVCDLRQLPEHMQERIRAATPETSSRIISEVRMWIPAKDVVSTEPMIDSFTNYQGWLE